MSTIMPKEKKVQDAVKWISEKKQEGKNLRSLVEEAAFKFNLNPKQEQYLYRLFLEGQSQE